MKKGYHAVYEKDYYEALSFAAEHEFDFVQFDLNVPTFFLDDIPDSELSRIREFAQSRNVRITFHGPCDNVSLFCDYPPIRRGILEQYQVILAKANALNARHITVHTGSRPKFNLAHNKSDSYLERFGDYYRAVLQDNLKALLRMSGGVMVCVENDGFDPFVMSAVDELLGAENLFLTMDIPKLYTASVTLKDEIYNYMYNNKDYIRELHIHDSSEMFGRHQNIGEGKIDFSFYRDFYLLEQAYFNFEIRPKEEALHSMGIFRQMFETGSKV